MNEQQLDSLFQEITASWEAALVEKRQQEVVTGGLLAYLFFQQQKKQAFENASLIYVRQAINELLAEGLPEQQPDRSQHVCSFCGRGQPEVRLAAGASGFICDKCVSQLGEVFKGQQV